MASDGVLEVLYIESGRMEIYFLKKSFMSIYIEPPV
jgi:hypothetical protein